MLHINFNDSKLFNAFSYPAGERQVRLTAEGIALVAKGEGVTVRAVLRSPQDIIDLALLKDAMERSRRSPIYKWTEDQHILELPYLPYSRADRCFMDGDCHGLATFAQLLFSMSWQKIVTLDVHNVDAARAWIGELTIEPADNYIRMAVERFCQQHKLSALTVVLPDEGAANRYAIPSHYGCNIHDISIETVCCTKKRDAATGVLSGFKVPMVNGPAMIVDDLCDGGGTFLGIGSQLLRTKPLGLYVTHGIFSRGLTNLRQIFDNIYTTDSYCRVSGTEAYKVTVFPVQF